MVAHLLTASRAPGSALDTGAEDAADCVGLFWRSFIMVKQVKVSNFAEVKGIVSAAAKCYNDVGVHDMKGSIADAKSILGMMSLDYSHPVKIVCEDERDLNTLSTRSSSKIGRTAPRCKSRGGGFCVKGFPPAGEGKECITPLRKIF